jgi:caffeoyl-CoA O-methyltransferase
MNFLQEDIARYAEDHSRKGPEYLEELTRVTWVRTTMPRMLSGHLQGRFLSMIAHLIRPKYVLEIGTFTGYSALCLAEGLQEGGYVKTIDINDELRPIQDEYFRKSGMESRIIRSFGNALDIIPSLSESFDLVFVDADKENYGNYYDLLIPMLAPGACLLFDNMLWSGKVLDPSQTDEETKTIRELNARINSDLRVENILLPLRDGLMMIRIK